MVQLRFENLIPTHKGGQPNSVIEFTNLAGLSPAEQWFYHWVQDTGLATPYPELEQVKPALETHLPQRTKRYSRNVPDPNQGESWLRLVLMSGELIKLQADSVHAPMTIAVHPSTRDWKEGFEKISSPEFSAVRHALGINKHWILVFEGIADAAPSSAALMNSLKRQSNDPASYAVIRFQC